MTRIHISGTGALLCCLLFMSASVLAQGSAEKISTTKPGTQAGNATSTQSEGLAGKFEGVAKSASIGDMAVTLDLQNQGGKISGKLETPHGAGIVKEVTNDAGRVSVTFDFMGDVGTIIGQLKGDSITGDWSVGGVGGTVELKRAAPAVKAPASATAATSDNISGVWEASADANGQPFPFTLRLKLEGDKVTGESSSSLGTSTISKGSWSNGTLTLLLDGQNGSTSLTASLKDGKLVGDFDYANQLQGKWSAVKK